MNTISNIRFFTTRLHGSQVAQFAIPVQIDNYQLELRGEIINSQRDQCLVVQWPRSKGGYFCLAPKSEGDTNALNRQILELYRAFQAKAPSIIPTRKPNA